MSLQDARLQKQMADEKLLSRLTHILRLEDEDRINAGYRDAESMIRHCKEMIVKHNKAMDKLLDSVPE